MTNKVLKEKMINDAQRLGVIYAKGEKEMCVSDFHKIGYTWK